MPTNAGTNRGQSCAVSGRPALSPIVESSKKTGLHRFEYSGWAVRKGASMCRRLRDLPVGSISPGLRIIHASERSSVTRSVHKGRSARKAALVDRFGTSRAARSTGGRRSDALDTFAARVWRCARRPHEGWRPHGAIGLADLDRVTVSPVAARGSWTAISETTVFRWCEFFGDLYSPDDAAPF